MLISTLIQTSIWNHPENISELDRVTRMLMCDLRDIAVKGTLPPTIKSIHKKILEGAFFLQVLDARDVHKANQTQNTSDDENDDDTGSNGKKNRPVKRAPNDDKRLLKLTLTDGFTQVEAIERLSIPSLNGHLGEKIMVVNPSVYHGILVLDDSNTTVMGGYCEPRDDVVSANADAPTGVQVISDDNSNDVVDLTLVRPVQKSTILTESTTSVSMMDIDSQACSPSASPTNTASPSIALKPQACQNSATGPQDSESQKQIIALKRQMALEKRRAFEKSRADSQSTTSYTSLANMKMDQLYWIKGIVTDTIKFRFKDGQYALSVEFSDGETTAAVVFDSKYVVKSLIGLSESTLSQMKQSNLNGYKLAMENLQRKLKSLEGLFLVSKTLNSISELNITVFDVQPPTDDFWSFLQNQMEL